MASVGLFFGSDTGNTEHIAKMIQKELGKNLIDVKDIAKSSKEDIAEFDLLLLSLLIIGYQESFFLQIVKNNEYASSKILIRLIRTHFQSVKIHNTYDVFFFIFQFMRV